VGWGILGFLLEYSLGTHRCARGFTLKEKHTGDAEMGICLMRVQFEDALEAFTGVV
jgi:hypothetical protein